jgi:hypothetical protein
MVRKLVRGIASEIVTSLVHLAIAIPFIYALTGVDAKADPIPISSQVAISATAGIDLPGGCPGTTYGLAKFNT